jgi:hypothetical protein
VSRRRLDGGDVETLATGQAAPREIVVLGGGTLVWLNGGELEQGGLDGAVMSMAIGGGTPAVVAADQAMPVSIVTDGANVYWTSFGTNDGGFEDGAIRAVGSGGTIVTMASGQRGPRGLAVDGDHVYWGNYYDATVMRVARRGGGGAPELVARVAVSPVAGRPSDVAIDERFVYWTDVGGEGSEYGDGALRRIAKAGGEVETLARGQAQAGFLVVEGTQATWTNGGGNGGGSSVMTLAL